MDLNPDLVKVLQSLPKPNKNKSNTNIHAKFNFSLLFFFFFYETNLKPVHLLHLKYVLKCFAELLYKQFSRLAPRQLELREGNPNIVLDSQRQEGHHYQKQ